MITNAASAPKMDLDLPKSSLKSSKDGLRPDGLRSDGLRPEADAAGSSAPDWNYQSQTSLTAKTTDDLYIKYTTKAGDVVELHAGHSEEIQYDDYVSISADAKALAAGREAKDSPLSADAAKQAAADEAADPKAQQLKELREWAKEVEREVRKQSKWILEQSLKQSGKQMDLGDGRYLAIFTDGKTDDKVDGTRNPGSADENGDAQVPPYWNAENTSDRIVHFATQMAEISGMDPKEFAGKIKDAIGKGFDQAAAATGPMTGAAAKLNQNTKDLVFTKLSKWLEERQAQPYNQGAQSPALSTADVHDGTENHQQ